MTRIAPVDKDLNPLALGCWIFDKSLWSAEHDAALLETMEAALARGINHFDTATGYGSGASERLIGRFLQGQREQVFVASKANISSEDPLQIVESVQRSLERLQIETIDLYYLHWPRSDMDIRRAMEGLEMARQRGLLRAVGLSNFNAAQMQKVSEVGQIDALQIPYNLFWRFAEQDAIAYCVENRIPVITYSSIAQGSLTGKFPRDVKFSPSDQRSTIVLFEPQVWPHLFDAVEKLKTLAQEVGRPLVHLAIQWSLSRPGIASTLVGARSPAQVEQNAQAVECQLPAWVFERMTAISDEAMQHIPNTGNPYRYYP